MADWVQVCPLSQLLPGEMAVAWDGDTAIAGLTSIVVAEAVYRAAREGRRVAVEMPQIAKGAGR